MTAARRIATAFLVAALASSLNACGSSSASSQSAATQTRSPGSPQPPSRWGIVIHSGAGNLTLDNLADRREPMRAAMTQALEAGHTVLAGGGSSLDAVQAAIVVMEDSPLFNAGKGAVFTHEGTNELDAAVMDGARHRAGAVAGVTHVKNPIRLARLVMEKSPHVMMVGDGAEAFAKEQGGIELVPASYFRTDRAWRALQQALQEEKRNAAPADRSRDGHYGTVGAVALDQHGNLAAATSTGGLTNKRFGRVGDSPIIGAGTYANNASCGISATGTGEYFIRFTVAHDICARVEYRGMDVQAAADEVVQKVLKAAGGDGGVIGLDAHGNVAMSFNTSGMGRGYMGADGKAVIMFTAQDAAPLPAAASLR
jgi:beta-aspartyl-peptidase (threonine type)